MPSVIRALNSNVSLLIADHGDVTRNADVQLLLSESAFSNGGLVRARHLSCPGWYRSRAPWSTVSVVVKWHFSSIN